MFILRLTILIVVLALATGCGVVSLTGSGDVVTQEEAITSFDKLDVSQGFEVEVRQGDSFSVIVRVDDNIVEYLDVVKKGDALKIGLEPGRSYKIEDATMEVDVTMPELARLDLSGGSHVTLNSFRMAKALDADLSGGSHLGGDVEAGDVTVDLSGGSHVTLSGSAGDLVVDAAGGSHATIPDLAVEDADVNVSGGSHATVAPSGRLDADASGGSHVIYLGSPSMGRIDTSGSSSVKQN